MHLKKVIKKENKFFIEHYIIVDAIDNSNEYCEELNIKNCWRYLREIIFYIYWEWQDKKIRARRESN